MSYFAVSDGSDRDIGRRVDIPERKPMVIGRDITADVPLLDGRVSRHHARVEVRADGVYVLDLGSRNGSFVNNVPVTEQRLRNGDHLRVGDTVLVYTVESGERGAAVGRGETKSVANRLQAFYRSRTEKDVPVVRSAGPFRLLAFDIEGTMISTDGLSTEILEQVLREVCGVVKPFEGFPLAGRSETEIIRNALKAAGTPPERIKAERPRIVTRYATFLGNMLKRRPRGNILPGVRDLLDRLQGDDRWALALLTRKAAMTARLLLGHHGLLDKFPVAAFADDRELRDALPPLLLERAREALGIAFEPKDAVIVGDAARDIAVGKEAGMATVAVATGADTYEALADLKPTLLFHSFEDVDDVVGRLNGLMGPTG
jgi:phosphoglycolate phosphatase-like HAD superfamily hydrolase